MSNISRVTSKYQVTIPAEVRKRLGVRNGDRVAFELEEDRVTLRRVAPVEIEYAAAIAGTLNEWISAEDEQAYRDL